MEIINSSSSSTSEIERNVEIVTGGIVQIVTVKMTNLSVEADPEIVAETGQRKGTNLDQNLDPSQEAGIDLGRYQKNVASVVGVMTNATVALKSPRTEKETNLPKKAMEIRDRKGIDLDQGPIVGREIN